MRERAVAKEIQWRFRRVLQWTKYS